MNDELRGILGELVAATSRLVGLPREAMAYAVSPELAEGETAGLADMGSVARLADSVLNRLVGMDLSIPVPGIGPLLDLPGLRRG